MGEVVLRRKRKGSEEEHETVEVEADVASSSGRPEIVACSRKTRVSLSDIGSCLSLKACRRQRKKCKEQVEESGSEVASFKKRGVVTAPPCGSSLTELPGRGIKRKIGCIDCLTRMGRKKKIVKDYVLGDEIGKGRFGSVKLCKSKVNGAEFACKTLRKGEETVHREVEIMQHLSGHPGVVTLQAVYEDPECFHLVMELCSGGRLVDQMVKEGNCSECRAAGILKELMSVIKYCHEMGVVHRDIKPENILLTTSGSMKLADFGLATRVSSGQKLSGVAGSPAYVAPEVLMGKYSEKVDIWSAGVLLHALLVGFLPFQGDSLEAVFEAIKTVSLKLDGGVWDSISKPARDLIGRMLTRDESLRLTADEVLRHPWLLFHTEQILKTTASFKSKVKNCAGGRSCQLASIPRVEKERNKAASASLSYGSDRTSSRYSVTPGLEVQEDLSLVDALAAAISRVRISAPKRSRLCAPSTPIQQDCSSNVKAISLCTAF
ncbi:Serine/threonine-protein kinase PEPKR2 [Thalictrum thalictroides]|uniref:Serine/threonine-protein kinase PEPKR2 n=1 Tax=Thalictrum thalictroides TaxID=46969 RepID=A0A7J6WZJ5_THATH|nr:Serine/threonine-protein kinase PEPKR2 [Thalictrum thalictroides]